MKCLRNARSLWRIFVLSLAPLISCFLGCHSTSCGKRELEELLRSQKDVFSYASNLVDQKISEIEAESSVEVQAELGTDFLTYMIHSGSLNVGEDCN